MAGVFEPGPPSTSRKKRRQIGAFVQHVKRVDDPEAAEALSRLLSIPVIQGTRPTPHPKSRRIRARRARKAMGARGVKTNSQYAGRN